MKTISIDCGANVGNITQQLLTTADEVHAFEPNPYAFNCLEARFLYESRVICHNNAVLDREEEVKLFLHENSDKDELHWSTGSSLLDFKSNVLKDKYTTVKAIDLCDFIQKLNSPIEILKIDVEGVEYEIINKLIDTELIYKIKKVFVELHAKKISELQPKEDLLKQRIKELNLTNINLDWI